MKKTALHKVYLAGMLIVSVFVFATGATAAGPTPVNLGTAGVFVILSETGITTAGTTTVVGDMGVSPIVATAERDKYNGIGCDIHDHRVKRNDGLSSSGEYCNSK
jgi:hypothetical protein